MKRLLPLCVAAGLLGVGTLAILDAQKSAKTYGLPTDDGAGLGFVRACGARDVVVGLALLTQLDRPRNLLLLSTVIAAADFTIVSTSAKETPPASSLAIHGGGALALLITVLLV